MAASLIKAALSLKAFIQQEALRLGFDKVGFTAPAALGTHAEHLEIFLKEGRHGGMVWLENRQAERADIRAYWPAVKTVVVLAMNYYTPPPVRPEDGPRWSNYAWGNDYHKVLKKRLRALLAAVQSEAPEVEGLSCVDTSPVMEKVWAQRAGLGWQGKHTNLITRDMGSWIFLGVLLLDVALSPDAPFADDLCGSCTACLDACPTGALDDAYQLDARRCISYLTIEHRGPFSEEQAQMLGDWIYGCDICQDVCPWNEKFAVPAAAGVFAAREFASWDWDQWAALDEEDWDLQFRGSAARRPGYDGLKRNLAAAKPVDTTEGLD